MTLDAATIAGTADEAIGLLAAHVSSLGEQAVRQRGVFHLALSGGSTPRPLYSGWAAGALPHPPWRDTEIWIVDERDVGFLDAESNGGALERSLVQWVRPRAFHAIRMEATDRVERYAAELEGVTIDLVVLGVGTDGHTASLFPGAPTLASQERVAFDATRSRVTMTLPILREARSLAFLVTGADKAPVLSAIRAGLDVPATEAARRPDVRWFVDAAAGGLLDSIL